MATWVNYAKEIKESIEELKGYEAKEKHAKKAKRYQFFRLLKEDSTRNIVEVADILGFKRVTGDRLIQRYREGGLDYACAFHYPGRIPNLNLQQEKLLREKAEQDGFLTCNEAREWIERAFGIKMCPSGVAKMFHRLKITWKTVRPSHTKKDPQHAEDFKKKVS